MLAGALWLYVLSRRRRGLLAEIETDLENTLHAHEQRAPAAGPAPVHQADGARPFGLAAGTVD